MVKICIKSGDVYNRLTIIKEVEPDVRRYRGKNFSMRRFMCRCACGKEVTTWLSHLRRGEVKSCGCYLRDRAKQTALKHFRKPAGESQLNDLCRRYEKAANKRGLAWNLSKDVVRRMIHQNCTYCGRPPHNLMKRRDGHYYCDLFYTGIDRIDSALGYEPDNCIPCCKDCNFAKQKLTMDQFLELVACIFNHTKNMDLNSFIDIAKKVTGQQPDTAPSVDHSNQTSVALDMARRQAEQKPVEQKPIPPLGVMPIPN